MKGLNGVIGVLTSGGFLGFTALVFANNVDDEIKSGKYIEFFFYKKSTTTSKAAAATTSQFNNSTINNKYADRLIRVSSSGASNNAELMYKLKMPIDHLDSPMKHEYCLISTGNSISVSSTPAATCTWTKYAKYDVNEKKYPFYSKIAKKFLKVQHFLNLIQATKMHSSSESTQAASAAPATACSCTCTAGKSPNCQCKTNGSCTNQKCCCCFCCVDKITVLDDEKRKKFLLSISNLVSSYAGVYFSPVQAHIMLSDFQDNDLTTTSTSEKKLHGILVYSYMDYYYNTIKNENIDWVKKTYDSGNNIKTAATSNGDTYFSNYPLTLSYKWNADKNETEKSSVTAANCVTGDLEESYEEMKEVTKLLRGSIKTENSKIKNLIACSKVGELKKTDLNEVKTIFDSVCSCK